MAKLYEITNDFKAVLDMDIETAEDGDAMVSLLEEVKARFEDKAEGVMKIVRMTEGEVSAFKQEEERIYKARKAREKKIEWLKEYLRQNMKMTETKVVQAGTFKLMRVASKPSVLIQDETALPGDYIIRKETFSPDKMRIFEVLSGGGQVPGAALVPNEYLKVS
jgi:hypothetical protein